MVRKIDKNNLSERPKLKPCSKCGEEVKSVSKKEFDKMLKSCFNTPPLRLKDLKEQLRKGR